MTHPALFSRPRQAALYGAYVGPQAPTSLELLQQQTAKRFSHAMDFFDGSGGTTGWDGMVASAQSVTAAWEGTTWKMIFSVPLLPSGPAGFGYGPANPSPYDSASGFGVITGGTEDSVFTGMAQAILNAGFPDAVIRLAWEFNSSSSPWGVNGSDQAAFIAAVQHVVGLFRAVSSEFTYLSFNPLRGDLGVGDLMGYYPGDAACDWMGLDLFDEETTSYPGISTEWSTMQSQTYGLDWLITQASAHSKRVALGSWGACAASIPNVGATPNLTPGGAQTVASGPAGGGDDDAFYTDVLGWVKDHEALSVVWSYGNTALQGGTVPRSAAAYGTDGGQGGYWAAPTLVASLPAATAGVAYSASILSDYPGPSVTCVVTSGSPPSGLTLSSSGLLSGTPTGSGSFSFTVRASNPLASPAATYTVVVGEKVWAQSGADATAAGATSITATLASATNGRSLVLAVQSSSTTATSSVTGGPSGVSWAKVVGDSETYGTVEVWVGTGYASTNQPISVTATFSAAANGRLKLFETAGGAAVDVSASATGSGTSASVTTAALAGSGEPVLALVNAASATSGENFAEVDRTASGWSTQWETSPTAAALTASWTLAAAGSWNAVIVAFQPNAAFNTYVSAQTPWSYFRQALPAARVVAPGSAQVTTTLTTQLSQSSSGTLGMDFDPYVVVPPGQSSSAVTVSGSSNLPNGEAPLPASAQGLASSAGPLLMVNPATGEAWEFTGADYTGGAWSAVDAGYVAARNAPGAMPAPYGVSASGLPYSGLIVSQADVYNGAIDHAVALLVAWATYPPAGSYWPPANRFDAGDAGGVNGPVEGMLLSWKPGTAKPTGLSAIASLVYDAIATYGVYVIDATTSAQAGTNNGLAVEFESAASWAAQGGSGTDPITAAMGGQTAAQALAPLGNLLGDLEVVAPLSSAGAPAAPSGLKLGTAGNGSVQLSWTGVAGALYYLVEYSADGGTSWTLWGMTSGGASWPTGTAVTVTGLGSGTYTFRVWTMAASTTNEPGLISSSPSATVSTAVSGAPDPGSGYPQPYSAEPWRTPIGASPTDASNASTLVSKFISDYTNHYGTVGVNSSSSCPTRYVVHGAAMPTESVTIVGHSGTWAGTLPSVPIPSNAVCDPTTNVDDHEMVIYDLDNQQVWEFWRAVNIDSSGRPTGAWTFTTYASMSTADTSGVFTRGAQSNTVAASGISYLAVLITADDLASGSIDHAIACAMISTASPPVAPANYSDGSTSGGVPEGTCFYFPASVTKPAGLTRFASMVFDAIQNYGMYLVDTAGAVVVYCENTHAWTYEGLADPITPYFDGKYGYQQITGFPWSQMSVLSPSYTRPAPTATAPAWTADSPPASAMSGTSYDYTFAASGTPSPTYALASGSLPPGLTLGSNGVLSGTPSAVGSFTFAVTASNSAGSVTTGSITVNVSALVTSAPAWTADSPPTAATVGTAYRYTFAASGSPSPTYAVASGALPAGLSLSSSSGVLSGTPTTAGTGTFTVSASNSAGSITSPSITVTTSPSASGGSGTGGIVRIGAARAGVATSTACQVATPAVAGQGLLVSIALGTDSATVSSITDTAGNGYTLLADSGSSTGGPRAMLYGCSAPAALSTSDTLTVATSATSNIDIVIEQVPAAAQIALTGAATSAGSSATANTAAGAATAVGAGDTVYALAAIVGSVSPTAAAGWSSNGAIGTGPTLVPIYQLDAPAGSTTASVSWPGGGEAWTVLTVPLGASTTPTAFVQSKNDTAEYSTTIPAALNTPATVGNYLVAQVAINTAPGGSYVTGITGGGVGTWTRLGAVTGGPGQNELWGGFVTTAGATGVSAAISTSSGVMTVTEIAGVSGATPPSFATTSGASSAPALPTINYSTGQMVLGFCCANALQSTGAPTGFTALPRATGGTYTVPYGYLEASAPGSTAGVGFPTSAPSWSTMVLTLSPS